MTSNFNDELHSLILSEDGTYTAYSKEYDEHYHSTKDGALYESLVKHVIPALKFQKDKDEINILDICFGLGFNTLATIHYVQKNGIKSNINIYSPELDTQLVFSLNDFTYPEEFKEIEHIISSLVESGKYDDEQFHIEVFLGDARKYILDFEEEKFDIVYQDAFSPTTNPILWTQEYFRDIRKIIKNDGILTTYSIALATRLALYENGLKIYLNEGEGFRKSTLASPSSIETLKEVNMQHKITCNPDARSLRD
ncbi:MAG: tRNA U34 5-methylaminomethyl-2-thiouridine-forming methyltransferase MnmC [Sulfurimonas sp.]|jgi:tRNA U34 5-methylaminomethyl-2-thiouridine-forming methyltransferase MnmC|uniref:tRNA (5-methylaminomethyl-2-thiouridine)(34)-methyltransferase MnmD n=1 Tax=Sulfurimonas sp. TaxID=2022749 RepID=UPI0039E70EEC